MRLVSAAYAIVFLWTLFQLRALADDLPSPAGEPPPAGYARLYIFRPDFSEVSRDDSPVVTIDGTEILQLAHKSYTSVVLRPGAHDVVTTPGTGEPEFWNSKSRISVEADKTHYLAVWNEVQVGAGELGSITPYLGLLGAAMDNSARSTSVRFEMVSKTDALASMKSLLFVAPRKSRIEP